MQPTNVVRNWVSYYHPEHNGGNGEALSCDVAIVGCDTAEKALLVISGTHGAEGYAGSGYQVSLLRSKQLAEISQRVKIVLIHGLNPYGFMYGRRVNENNVDINRNNIDFDEPRPVNKFYKQVAETIMPSGAIDTDYQTAFDLVSKRIVEEVGYKRLQQVFQPGQYEDPDGLFYGGTARSWSLETLDIILREHLAGISYVTAIDIHTGLGPKGVGELLLLGAHTQLQTLHSYLTAPFSIPGDEDSVSEAVTGHAISVIQQKFGDKQVIGATLEFGTLPVNDILGVLILENWATKNLSADHPFWQECRQKCRSAFYCEDESWEEAVIQRTSEVVGQMLNILEHQ